MNKKRYAINILVLLMLILTMVSGTKTVFDTNWKIVSTAASLSILHDNAQFYNEQHRKTDAMTEEYLKNQAEREKFYQSEDSVIRFFSNQHILVKALILVLVVVTTLSTPVMWLFFLFMIKRQMFPKKKRKKPNHSQKIVPIPQKKEAKKMVMI